MFILPFLKYLRPHRKRLILAVFCMFVGGFVGSYQILIGKPALDVLMGEVNYEERLKKHETLVRENAHKLEKTDPDDEFNYWRRKIYYPVEIGVSAAALKFYEFARTPNDRSRALRLLAVMIIVIAGLNAALEYGMKYNLSYSLYGAVIRMKSDIFAHVLRQDMRFFHTRSVGYLMSRVTSDVNSLGKIFEILITDAVQQVILLLFLSSMLIFISAALTAYVFLMILPAIGILAWFAHQIKKVTRRQRKKQDQLSSVMNESLGNVRLIKSSCTEQLESDKFDVHNQRLFYYQMKRRMAKFGSSPIMEFLGGFGVAGILLAGGYAVGKQDMEFSTFVVYIATLTRFYRPVKKLARANVNWQECKVSAHRIREMLELEPQILDAEESGRARLEQVREGIRLENVHFAYDDKKIIDGVSTEFPASRTTAIVGRTGSGKTTLANLLLRLYDPDEGRILIDGQDIRNFRLAELRGLFSIVSQEINLFSDTVAENIAYGADHIDRARVEAAARAAHAHDFIMSLDGGLGYDTPLGPSGNQLSGGQRQRITIARAFYRDPQILILDEATSSLDNESEAAIQDSLAHLMEGRTVVVIAHRLSTIQHADNIIVLDEGRILEQGHHQSLLDQGGHYAKLYRLGEFVG